MCILLLCDPLLDLSYYMFFEYHFCIIFFKLKIKLLMVENVLSLKTKCVIGFDINYIAINKEQKILFLEFFGGLRICS